MENLKRCPGCFHLPEPTIDNDGSVTFECKQHGHMATGSNIQEAAQNWNTYITLIAQEVA